MNRSFTIAILCYNEAGAIAAVIQKALEVADQLAQDDTQIVVVDDGSTDHSVQIIRQLQQQYPTIHLIENQHNQGIGASTIKAHQSATGELIYVVSGDGEANLDEVLCDEVRQLDEDSFILFERQYKTGYNAFRRFLTWSNKLFNYLIFGEWINDVNWNKVVWKKHIQQIQPELKSVLIDSEITFKLLKKGIRIQKVSTTSLPRIAGIAKGGNRSSVWSSVMEMVHLWKTVRNIK